MAELKSIQTGTITIAAGSASNTAPITSVDTSKAFVVRMYSLNNANPDFNSITIQLTNATTVTATRPEASGSPAVTVRFYVAEFVSGVSVQRGAADMSGISTLDVTISAVTTAQSFVLATYRNRGGSFNADDWCTVAVLDSTHIRINLNANGAATSIVEWQVVDYIGCSVQAGLTSFITTDSSKTATVTSVDKDLSWLIYTCKTDAGTTANIGQKAMHGVITNGTTLTFTRDQTGQATQVEWQLITFSDGTTVRQGSVAFGTGDTNKTDTLSPAIDLSKTIPYGGWHYGTGGKCNYTADDNPGIGTADIEFTDSTTISLTRALTGSVTADIGWFVLEFVTSSGKFPLPFLWWNRQRKRRRDAIGR